MKSNKDYEDSVKQRSDCPLKNSNKNSEDGDSEKISERHYRERRSCLHRDKSKKKRERERPNRRVDCRKKEKKKTLFYFIFPFFIK